MIMINAIILAGKSENQLIGERTKGLIDIKGKPMISYVMDALKESGMINKILIIGDHGDLSRMVVPHEVEVIDDRGSILDNVITSVEYFNKDHRILIVTCDIPFLTVEAVNDFVEKSLKSHADICYPIIEKNVCESKYPLAKRTYAKLKEGTFTGGNMILLNPKVLDRCIPKAKDMINYRKNPMKMSRVLGVSFLLKLSMGILTIGSVEKRVEKLLGIKPKAIITQYAEIGNDVDKPEDIEMVNRYMA